MKRFIEGEDRKQVTLLPECLDDFIAEDNPVRIIDAFVEELELGLLGFDGATPSTTGRPSYHPAVAVEDLHLPAPKNSTPTLTLARPWRKA
jgi:transposase